jgi:hypothetical protein
MDTSPSECVAWRCAPIHTPTANATPMPVGEIFDWNSQTTDWQRLVEMADQI